MRTGQRMQRRLERLETQLISDPFVLYMADGSTRHLYFPGTKILDFYMAVLSGDVQDPETRKHIEWVRNSIYSIEPGGGHILDLIRCFLKGPVPTGADSQVIASRAAEERWPVTSGESGGRD